MRSRHQTSFEKFAVISVGRQKVPAVLPEGPHPIPSRTRKLRPSGPMVLQGKLCGRVGRRRELFPSPESARADSGLLFCARPPPLPSIVRRVPTVRIVRCLIRLGGVARSCAAGNSAHVRNESAIDLQARVPCFVYPGSREWSPRAGFPLGSGWRWCLPPPISWPPRAWA